MSEATERLHALDVFRGVTIAAMILVSTPGSWESVYPWLEHAPWHGCTLADLVFPFLLFAMGAAVPFALSSGKKGAVTGVAVAVGIAVVYTVVSRLFEAMGDLSQLPPALAAWSPDLVFMMLGGYLILKVPT